MFRARISVFFKGFGRAKKKSFFSFWFQRKKKEKKLIFVQISQNFLDFPDFNYFFFVFFFAFRLFSAISGIPRIWRLDCIKPSQVTFQGVQTRMCVPFAHFLSVAFLGAKNGFLTKFCIDIVISIFFHRKKYFWKWKNIFRKFSRIL